VLAGDTGGIFVDLIKRGGWFEEWWFRGPSYVWWWE